MERIILIAPQNSEAIGTTPVVNEGYIKPGYDFNIARYGKIIVFELNAGRGSVLAPGLSTVITGIPRAKFFIDIVISVENASIHKRAWVNAEGSVSVYISDNWTGNVFIGGTYISEYM